MFCPNCGSKIEEDKNFCGYCGYSKEGKEKAIRGSKRRKNLWIYILVGVVLMGILCMSLNSCQSKKLASSVVYQLVEAFNEKNFEKGLKCISPLLLEEHFFSNLAKNNISTEEAVRRVEELSEDPDIKLHLNSSIKMEILEEDIGTNKGEIKVKTTTTRDPSIKKPPSFIKDDGTYYDPVSMNTTVYLTKEEGKWYIENLEVMSILDLTSVFIYLVTDEYEYFMKNKNSY